MECNKLIQQCIEGKKAKEIREEQRVWKEKRKKWTELIKKARGREQTFLTAAAIPEVKGDLSNHPANIDWAST